MSSDSSETQIKNDVENFVEVEKTLYLPKLNIAVSTWGDAMVENQGINPWLEARVIQYCQAKAVQINYELIDFTEFLCREFNRAFGFDGTPRLHDHHLGVHVGGYNDGVHPGLCHVFIEKNKPTFEAQPTLPSLPPHVPAFHLRNGMYEEFALFWPALSGIDESFRMLIQEMRSDSIVPHTDPVAIRAEWIGNWVKHMCLSTKNAGLPEYIGKTVRVVAFDHEAKPRKFRISEMQPA